MKLFRLFRGNDRRNKAPQSTCIHAIGSAFADDMPARDQLIKGISLYQSGKYLPAVNALKKLTNACQNNADSAAMHYFLGLCRDALGDYAPAANHYRSVLSADPDHVPAQIRVAMHCIDQHDPDEAIARLTRALELDPTACSAQALLITAKNMSGK